MKRQSLDQHLRDHYESTHLRPEKIEQLMMQAEVLEKNSNQHKSFIGQFIGAGLLSQSKLTLGLLSLLCVAFVVGSLRLGQSYTHDLSYLVAQEIALNHRKNLNVEFPFKQTAQLSQVMDKLEFAIHDAIYLTDAKLELRGGRYCSIQGQMAAQLKYKDEQGVGYTLYQTNLTPLLNKLEAGNQVIDGVSIRYWKENDRLFGLAQTVE